MRHLITCLLSLSLCAAAPPAQRHVLIVGDSEACRVGWFVQSTKPPTDSVAVECKESTRVQYWSRDGHLAEALDRHPEADDVVVFLGTNNFHDQVAPDVGPALDAIASRGLGCVWVGNVAVRGKTWKINGLLRDAVAPRCTYFDTEAAGIQLDDGIHPGHDASVKWLSSVWPLIPPKQG